MKITISLKDKKEITTDLSEEEYQKLKKSLTGQVKMVEIENQIINTSFISRVEPIADQKPITKEYRLPNVGGTGTEDRIRVRGGWQKPSVRENMIELFKKLKSVGNFKEFATYEDWEFAIHKDDKDYLLKEMARPEERAKISEEMAAEERKLK